MRTKAINILIIFLLLVCSGFAQDWQQRYDQALRDLEGARWEEAIAKLQEAVKQQPISGQTVTGAQGQSLRYFPYYLLGKAHFHLGRYSEAADYFTREARQSGLPVNLARDIADYQQQIRTVRVRNQSEFNQALEQAQAARLKGAFAEAAAKLERARELDSIEFKARGMDVLLASIRQTEKKRADESRFRLLLKEAEEKEKQNALRDVSSLLQEADRLMPGNVEVDRIRARIEKREQTYSKLKEAAANDEKEGRLAAAVDKLRQAAQADPERFMADRLPDRLAQLAAAISRQSEIQQSLLAGAQALREGDYARAIISYNEVLKKDSTHRVAVEQKRRAESLQLLDRAQNFIKDRAFSDAFGAFSLAYDLDSDNGKLIYERMRPHLGAFSKQQDWLRREWLDLMRDADPDRYESDNRNVAAAPPRPRQRQKPPAPKPAVEEDAEKAQQKAVMAAIQGPPQEAVRLLERLRATRGRSNAELESWTGVAYARLSLLTSDPDERKRLHAKASQHFKLALRLNPNHQLDPRLVAPHIQQIFSDAQQGE